MKKRFAVLVLSLAMAAPALALGPVDLTLDFVTKYVWRGFDLNPVGKPAVQLGATYAVGESGLAVNIWSSFSFENKAFTELDLTVSYSKEVGPISLTAGFIHYGWYFGDSFKFGDNTTQEIFASASLGVPLSPTLTLAYDFNLGSGLYAEASVSHSLGLGPVSLDLTAAAGFNLDYWIAKTGPSHVALRAAVPVELGAIAVTPSANLTVPLMDEVSTEDMLLWFDLPPILAPPTMRVLA